MPASLNIGDILVVLFGRSEPDTFHWTICVPISATVAAKYHVKQSGTNWWFDYSEENGIPEHSVTTSATVSVGIKIGSLDPRTVNKEVLTQYLKTIEIAVPAVDQAREPKFTCRVWFREAIRVLNNAGVLNCEDVDALEEECKEYGKANQAAFADYKGYLYYVSDHSA